jgi:osmotically-inducible protein OsmY
MRVIKSVLVALLLLSAALLFAGCEREEIRESAGSRASDARITDDVEAALENSTAFKFPDVHISTYNGRVQLSGFVSVSEQKEAAEAIAENVPGVEEVENKISIK